MRKKGKAIIPFLRKIWKISSNTQSFIIVRERKRKMLESLEEKVNQLINDNFEPKYGRNLRKFYSMLNFEGQDSQNETYSAAAIGSTLLIDNNYSSNKTADNFFDNQILQALAAYKNNSSQFKGFLLMNQDGTYINHVKQLIKKQILINPHITTIDPDSFYDFNFNEIRENGGIVLINCKLSDDPDKRKLNWSQSLLLDLKNSIAEQTKGEFANYAVFLRNVDQYFSPELNEILNKAKSIKLSIYLSISSIERLAKNFKFSDSNAEATFKQADNLIVTSNITQEEAKKIQPYVIPSLNHQLLRSHFSKFDSTSPIEERRFAQMVSIPKNAILLRRYNGLNFDLPKLIYPKL